MPGRKRMRGQSEEAGRSQEPGLPLSIGQLGVVLLLVSISVLFFASCVAVLITFGQGVAPGGTDLMTGSVPPVPWGLAASTLLLAGTSGTLQLGYRSQRDKTPAATRRYLRWAGGFALFFLLAQSANCLELLSLPGNSPRHSLFLFAFNLLVGLHAVHVLGGLLYLAVCLGKLNGGAANEGSQLSLKYCVQYWHYLGCVWLPLVGTLLWVH